MSTASMILDKIERRHRETPTQTAKRREIFRCLNRKLELLNWVGKVVSIITFSLGDQRIRCYGHMIPPSALFARIPMPIGKTIIAYPPFTRLASWETGYFVQLKEFEPKLGDNLWVAMINIVVGEMEPVIPYHCRPRIV